MTTNNDPRTSRMISSTILKMRNGYTLRRLGYETGLVFTVQRDGFVLWTFSSNGYECALNEFNKVAGQ